MKKILKKSIPYFLIVIGAMIAAFSVACILLPNGAIDYGTAGIGIIISKLVGSKLSLTVILVFLPFMALGYIFLGRRFFIKSLIGSLAYTLGIEMFAQWQFKLNTEPFLAVAFGGAILGAGLSLVLRNGGCIDGSEILANIIAKKISKKTGKDHSLTTILIVFNALVYTAVFILINSDAAMQSLLVYVVATVVIDKETDRFEAIKKVSIITREPDVLVEEIMKELEKTCTLIKSEGAVAGENTTLICYVNYFELQKMRDILEGKNAFCTVSNIDEIIK